MTVKIGHLFKIENHYTNIVIDRRSIIGDNYLLNVFLTAWNNLTLRVCLTEIKRRIQLYQIKTQNLFSSFAVVAADFKIYRQEHYKSDRNTTNLTGTLQIRQEHYKSDRNTTNLTETLQIWQEHYKSDRNTTNLTETLQIWQEHYKSDRNTTNQTGTLQILVVETFLLNRICYNFWSLFKNIEILLPVIVIRMDC
jgi:hypothetical protein